MELLGLQPGASAGDHLDEVAAGPLPETAVKALVAATGMTGAQARALTAPRPARPDLAAVRRIPEANFATGRYRRVGAGKTSTARGLSTAVALAFAQRAGMMDPDGAAPATARLLAAAGGRRPLLTDTEPPATSHQTLAPLLLGDASSPLAWSDERRLSRATHHPGEG